MNHLYVGAGKAEIVLPTEFAANREGFTRLLDPLYVRVLLIRGDSAVALVSLDLTSLMGGNDEIRNRVSAITGADYVWVTVSHTFSAPHIQVSQDRGPGGPKGPGGCGGMPPLSPEEQAAGKAQADALWAAIDAAAKQATDCPRPACAYAACGRSTVNTGRDVETREGWWLAEGSDAYADHALPVVFYETPESTPLAVLYNFPVQSSVLDHAVMADGGLVVSGDLAGRASAYIEKEYPVALFLCGAAGDQAPRQKASTNLVSKDGSLTHIERGEAGIEIKNALGDELGQAVLASRAGAEALAENSKIAAMNRFFSVPAKVMPDRSKVAPRTVADFKDNGVTQSNVELLRIGALALVGVKPELSASIGAAIRNSSPFPFTMIATMVNGGAKYMADREGFEHISYAAQNGPFGPGAAELLGEHALELLHEIAGDAEEALA